MHYNRFFMLATMVFLTAVSAQGCTDKTRSDKDVPAVEDTGNGDLPTGDTREDAVDPLHFDYGVPLAEDSPWPKFRRDAQQTGATPLRLTDDGSPLWIFPTGKGIFSSPVVGGDGTVYVGSADHIFYALHPDGTEKWRFATGEIIDSAALLDDGGTLYFGSGDGVLYALDAETGEEVWRFLADDPAENKAFIRWFEGNVTMGPDGTLYAGNDNFFVYALNREDGSVKWRFQMPDQTWSAAAVDPESGVVYIGNNNVLFPDALGNVFAISPEGTEVWKNGTLGTIAASPLLHDDGVFLGGYDGFTYRFSAATGAVQWAFGSRDHVYASPALHPDGSVIQASADGTVYSLEPSSGAVQWAFDWGSPLRSSPAIDGDGNIYVGTGDGHLLVLGADGRLSWAVHLIQGDRDDLNASPALGRHAIYIAGESGEIFGVPFGFCLREEEGSNPACRLEPRQSDTEPGSSVLFTTRFGAALVTPPETVSAHEPMAFTLQVRDQQGTVLALIDTPTLTVKSQPEVPLTVEVSANRLFFTVYPEAPFQTNPDGTFQLSIQGDYLTDPQRTGLRFQGGTRAGAFAQTFTFRKHPGGPATLGLPIPLAPGQPAGVWEMTRLAAPLPTLLPSYNQIGFDSLHFLVSLVEGNEEQAVAFVVEARPGKDGEAVMDPDSVGVFTFLVRYQDGRLTLENRQGMTLQVMSATLSFDLFRVSVRLDGQGTPLEAATVQATAICGKIPMYGSFLRSLGLCHPDPDIDALVTFGGVLLHPWRGGVLDHDHLPADAVSDVVWEATASMVTVSVQSSLPAADHHGSILLVDADTGLPVSLNYGALVTKQVSGDGALTGATLSLAEAADHLPGRVRAYLMIDALAISMSELDIQ